MLKEKSIDGYILSNPVIRRHNITRGNEVFICTQEGLRLWALPVLPNVTLCSVLTGFSVDRPDAWNFCCLPNLDSTRVLYTIN